MNQAWRIVRSRGAAVSGAAGLAAVLVLPGCGGGGEGGTGPAAVASVIITSPASPPTIGALERTIQFQAQARASDNTVLTGRQITWSSSNSLVASISPAGLLTALANGTTQVTATADGVRSAPLTVTVSQVTAQVVVTPATFTFQTYGRTRSFSAEARDSTNHALSGRTFTWSSTNQAVVTVDAAGTATAVSNGTALVQATADGVTGSAAVTVDAVAVAMTISSAQTFTRIGQQQQLTVSALDSSGNTIGNPTVTWTSNATSVASVNSSGVVTSVSDGTATITATAAGGLTAQRQVTVAAVAQSVAISPASVDFGAIGSTRQLSASVRDSGGTTIPGRSVTFSRAGSGSTATVSAAGLVTAVAVGNSDTAVATYTGGEGTFTARSPISVTQVVHTITVSSPSPVPDTLKTTGSTRTFQAAAADSNGNAIPGTTFTWSSTVPAVATVDNTGVVTAVADGTTSIQAGAGGRTGSRALVVRRFAATFSLSPTSATITSAGGTAQFTGTAQDSAGTNLPVTWVSRSTAVATVSPASGTSPSTATVTAVANGSTRLVLSGGTRSDSASITVNIPTTLSGDVQPILTANCALSGCHTGAFPQEGLNLSAGQTYANTVGVPAPQFPEAIRVIAGDPENSYLVRKIEGRNINGARMPQGAAPLTQQQINTIRAWIAAGAMNN
ncbi:MAG TPA: Ig-like domain-containing protein [Gemmatimonadales bacterium]|nr:Ig-like domain-containing protein [Gemmatimonadales bacterium]